MQPLIRPLYDSRGAHDVLGLIAGRGCTVGLRPGSANLASASASAEGFETWWRRALHDGVIANSAAQPVPTARRKLPDLAPAKRRARHEPGAGARSRGVGRQLRQ